jgi:hypothetical protein
MMMIPGAASIVVSSLDVAAAVSIVVQARGAVVGRRPSVALGGLLLQRCQ